MPSPNKILGEAPCPPFQGPDSRPRLISEGIKTRSLRYFVTVAEELNFRRAAERLFITQPPLSRAIQRLENELGTQLFERDTRVVKLTEAGQALLQEARSLLAPPQAELAQPPSVEAPGTVLRVGMTTVVDPDLFGAPELLLAESVPFVHLDVTRQISKRCVRAVKRRALDAALIGLPTVTDGLALEVLADDPLVAAIPTSHPMAGCAMMSVHDLADSSLFWFPRPMNPAFYDHCEALFRSLGFSPAYIPEPADHHVLLSLIAAGKGVALIPASLCSIQRKGVSYKPLHEHRTLHIGIGVVYRNENESDALRRFLAALRQHFATRSAPA